LACHTLTVPGNKRSTNFSTEHIFLIAVCDYIVNIDIMGNSTFSNISVIPWQSVLLVEETGEKVSVDV
jgi:hypothetical protein